MSGQPVGRRQPGHYTRDLPSDYSFFHRNVRALFTGFTVHHRDVVYTALHSDDYVFTGRHDGGAGVGSGALPFIPDRIYRGLRRIRCTGVPGWRDVVR